MRSRLPKEPKEDLSGKLIDELKDERPYSVHKQPALSGCDVGKRCKYQLIAGIMYHVNFWLRKVHRRSELFRSKTNRSDGKLIKASDEEVRQEYDEVLDALYKGLIDGYGGLDAINEVLDVVALKRGFDSQFEAVL